MDRANETGQPQRNSLEVVKRHVGSGIQESDVRVGEGYRIVTDGRDSHIVDASGKRVSKGYDGFDVFIARDQDGKEVVSGLIGSRGAVKWALRPPTEEEPRFEESKRFFHNLDYRPDLGGQFVIQLGAMQSIVNAKGESVTGEYHSFSMKDGKLYGNIGNRTEEIHPKNKDSSLELSGNH